MGIEEFLAMDYCGRSDLLVYFLGFVIVLVIWKIIKAGGISKPRKKK